MAVRLLRVVTATYNEKLGGYGVNITDQELKGAPKFDSGHEGTWSREYDQKVYGYYKANPYWGAE